MIDTRRHGPDKTGFTLEDGSRVGIIGGGPAGTMFGYFLLRLTSQMGLDVSLDIYEGRDFTVAGPLGCNMCGGIVSESLIQHLATEGIILPGNVIQRGVDSYILHTDDDAVRIETPLRENRVATVHRGGGPRDADELKWGGLDGYLMGLAMESGANVIRNRVSSVGWDEGFPTITASKETQRYDLLVGATGVNSAAWKLYEDLGISTERPRTTKAYITEIKLGEDVITQSMGQSLHIYLLGIPRIEFAAIIPKGDYVSICLLGKDIDRELIDRFFAHPQVKGTFPDGWEPSEGACHCAPRINIKEAPIPYLDRVVLVGDCGVTRLYKDGIGAAYRTAKAAALTAALYGVSSQDFEKQYMPTYKAIARDNAYGRFVFSMVGKVKPIRPIIRGIVRMTAREQADTDSKKRMSMILWDMFTGSAHYRDIFMRGAAPPFWTRFGLAAFVSIFKRRPGKKADDMYGIR